MNTAPDSEIVTLLKKQLKENNLNPACVKEFYCTNQNEFEMLKSDIKKIVKDNCRFFSKETNGSIHVIAFVNIEITKFEQASVKGYTEIANNSISNLFTKSKSLSKIAFSGNSINPANIDINPTPNKPEQSSSPITGTKPPKKSVRPASRIEVRSKNLEK